MQVNLNKFCEFASEMGIFNVKCMVKSSLLNATFAVDVIHKDLTFM